MNFVILGATGGVGLELVRQAVDAGHNVTALVRQPKRLSHYAGRIQIVPGDVLSRPELGRVLAKSDAVLSGFGPRLPLAKADADLLARFATALTGAMHDAAVRRLVIVSVAFLFRDAVLPPVYLLGRLLFPSVVADAAAMENIVAHSGLDWTIVRPPQFTDKPRTGKYRVREGHLPRLGFNIPRADVADYMLAAATTGAAIRKIVGVSR